MTARASEWYLVRDAPPERTPLLKMTDRHVVESTSFNYKLLIRLQLGDTWRTGIGQLVSVRIARLKEAGESSSEALVNVVVETWFLLNGVDSVPLVIVSASERSIASGKVCHIPIEYQLRV